MSCFIKLVLVINLALLWGCTRVQLTPEKGEKHQYFGFVEIIVPQTEKGIQARKVRSLGVALEDGLSIGWRDRELVLVPLKKPTSGGAPYEATCSIVLIIRSTKEAQHAADMLRSLEGEDICLAEFR